MPISKNPYMSPYLAADHMLKQMCPVHFVVRIFSLNHYTFISHFYRHNVPMFLVRLRSHRAVAFAIATSIKIGTMDFYLQQLPLDSLVNYTIVCRLVSFVLEFESQLPKLEVAFVNRLIEMKN